MSTTITTKCTRLTEQNVSRILSKCTHTPNIPSTNRATIEVEGIHKTYVLNKNLLESERQNIEHMLQELPQGFKQGWSFYEMYHTKTGRQWAYNIKSMESLMVLGVAIGKLTYPVPKSLWWSLPGGMPYITLN